MTISNDVIGVLLTGNGKTLIIQCLPFINNGVVYNPLNAIIQEQAMRFGTNGIVVNEIPPVDPCIDALLKAVDVIVITQFHKLIPPVDPCIDALLKAVDVIVITQFHKLFCSHGSVHMVRVLLQYTVKQDTRTPERKQLYFENLGLKYRENVQGSSKELKYFQYDESYNTCIDIRNCMRELIRHKLKECKPGIPGTPIDLQEVRKYAKNTFHKLVHRFNKELGIEFSENEEVKNELDTSRLRNDHYHEIKNCKQEQTPSEKYIIELEQKCEKDLLRQSQEEIKRIQQEHVNEMKKYQQLQEKQIKSQTQIETLHTELESIKEKENKLKQILHEMLEDRDRLQQEIQQIRREYKPYEQFADELNQQLQERNDEIHRLREELQKYISTNDDQIKEIGKLRISYLEAVEEAKNLTERLINKAPSVLPPDFLEKEGTKCQPFIRRSEVISMLLKSQGNKNDMSINESDENNQENNLTTIEEAVLEDRVCWNETSSSMRMNKMETHTTVYNISTSNVNMNTHCTVKQSDGVLSVEPGDPGVSMLTDNES